MADLLELALYLGQYVIGFWSYLFSKDFRAKVHEVWRARSGWAHWRTASEIVFALLLGPFPLVGPAALIGLFVLT